MTTGGYSFPRFERSTVVSTELVYFCMAIECGYRRRTCHPHVVCRALTATALRRPAVTADGPCITSGLQIPNGRSIRRNRKPHQAPQLRKCIADRSEALKGGFYETLSTAHVSCSGPCNDDRDDAQCIAADTAREHRYATIGSPSSAASTDQTNQNQHTRAKGAAAGAAIGAVGGNAGAGAAVGAVAGGSQNRQSRRQSRRGNQ